MGGLFCCTDRTGSVAVSPWNYGPRGPGVAEGEYPQRLLVLWAALKALRPLASAAVSSQ
jgi:hypothetical protein